MISSEVSLVEMLDAREQRAFRQKELLKKGMPLLCLTMNIAGPVKRTPLIRLLFNDGLRRVSAMGLPIAELQISDTVTGCEAFLCIDAPAETVKAAVTALEDAFPAARLFDLDVLDTDGSKLSRNTPRRCLLCDRPAADCASSRAHGLDALKEKTDALLCGFAAELLAEKAHDALCREVRATPKPGLVDAANCGAHKDMDLPMFLRSADALLPYFRQAVLHGLKGCTMRELREAGLAAESAMYAVTGGVNTHKGAVFSMGLLLYGMGRALRLGGDVTEYAAALVMEDAELLQECSRTAPMTNGGHALAAYGAAGARGEAMRGFPHARFAEEQLISNGTVSLEHREVLTLCDLMAKVDDTNLLHRGGSDGLQFVKSEAARISTLPTVDEKVEALRELDRACIGRDLSPGGCADLLALGILLVSWAELSEHLF